MDTVYMVLQLEHSAEVLKRLSEGFGITGNKDVHSTLYVESNRISSIVNILKQGIDTGAIKSSD